MTYTDIKKEHASAFAEAKKNMEVEVAFARATLTGMNKSAAIGASGKKLSAARKAANANKMAQMKILSGR